jgi:hypothetical protein
MRIDVGRALKAATSAAQSVMSTKVEVARPFCATYIFALGALMTPLGGKRARRTASDLVPLYTLTKDRHPRDHG